MQFSALTSRIFAIIDGVKLDRRSNGFLGFRPRAPFCRLLCYPSLCCAKIVLIDLEHLGKRIAHVVRRALPNRSKHQGVSHGGGVTTAFAQLTFRRSPWWALCAHSRWTSHVTYWSPRVRTRTFMTRNVYSKVLVVAWAGGRSVLYGSIERVNRFFMCRNIS